MSIFSHLNIIQENRYNNKHLVPHPQLLSLSIIEGFVTSMLRLFIIDRKKAVEILRGTAHRNIRRWSGIATNTDYNQLKCCIYIIVLIY